jgi:glycerate 2-kinase
MFHAALAATDPATAVAAHLQLAQHNLIIAQQQHYDLNQGRVFLVSVGKAAVPMAQAASQTLGPALHAGIVVAKTLPTNANLPPDKIAVYTGSHPVPGPDSVRAATAVQRLLQTTTANDLVLCLISGGASALLSQPLVSLDDWQTLNRALLASGCAIDEFNTVRRQLDAVKGGGLRRWAAPAACHSLILSDVVGNPLAFIGSGPTVVGDDTPADALAVLARYGMADRLATAVSQRIHAALSQQPPAANLPAATHIIVGDVRQAALAAQTRAVALGFSAHILTAQLEGEAHEVGRVAAAIAKDAPPNHCLILGGETTVTLSPGGGLGGRNLETALAAAIALAGEPRTAVASLATDGEDGPTDAAGAVVTGETAVLAHQVHLNPHTYLHQHDSYHFFQQLDQRAAGSVPPSLVQTGPTGTNVNDLIFILSYQA